MLVFILLMGEYLIPQLLGGGKVFFIGNALVDLFLQSPQLAVRLGGAAMALVVIMVVTVTLYLRRDAATVAASATSLWCEGRRHAALYALFVYLFLYAPLALIALFSFSAGRSASDFHGFSLQWY